MNQVKKSVDKSLFKKYLTIKQNSPDIPITTLIKISDVKIAEKNLQIAKK